MSNHSGLGRRPAVLSETPAGTFPDDRQETDMWADARFSDATLAALTEAVAKRYTHSQLDVLFLRLGQRHASVLDEHERRSNKLDRVGVVVEALRRNPQPRQDVLELLKVLLEESYEGRILGPEGRPIERLRPLVALLATDGWEMSNGLLVSTTPEPAPLAAEVTLLERELTARALPVAAVHYRQAVDNHRSGNLEASNGQLRSCLENLLLELGQRSTGRSTSDPKGAVEHLRHASQVDGDEANVFKGLVGMSNRNGAHHGLTDAEEALFRLHFTTAAARYLLAVLSS